MGPNKEIWRSELQKMKQYNIIKAKVLQADSK